MKCGTITHSAKETGQQKEQWSWGLEATGKRGGWTNLVREYRGEGLHKVGVVRISLPTMFWENRPEWASK